jgi:tRNA/tmRNA/rRNA uracil-C5-methylase (TrmA/RlmC/RlmD family)
MSYRAGAGLNPHDQVTLRIEDVAFGGAGVGRVDGFAVFVPFTITGELVAARVEQVRRHYALAQCEWIIEPASSRVTPLCPYFGDCGGCDYQHIDYAEQLRTKQKQVADQLRKRSAIAGPIVGAMIPSPNIYGFRNRITVHSDRKSIGFFRKNSRDLVDVEECRIATADVNRQLHEYRCRGKIQPHRTLRERPEVTTFSQTNDLVAKMMVDQVLAWFSGGKVVDAYCGSGFFAHRLADVAVEVLGIDWNRPAIEQARSEAAANEKFVCGDLGELLPDAFRTFEPDCIVLDPSAEGLSAQVTDAINEWDPTQIIYVSCNPSTFARDAERIAHISRLGEVRPFDMFPQTAQIELVAQFQSIRHTT